MRVFLVLVFPFLSQGWGGGLALEECFVCFTHLFAQVFSGKLGHSVGLQLGVYRRAAGTVASDPTSREMGVDGDYDLCGGFTGVGVVKEVHSLAPPDPVGGVRL